jgi:hypothetical protein
MTYTPEQVREAIENAIDIDGPGAQDCDARIIRALLDSGLVEAAMECEELWRGDYRNTRDTDGMQRRLNEARAAVSSAYRRFQGGEEPGA